MTTKQSRSKQSPILNTGVTKKQTNSSSSPSSQRMKTLTQSHFSFLKGSDSSAGSASMPFSDERSEGTAQHHRHIDIDMDKRGTTSRTCLRSPGNMVKNKSISLNVFKSSPRNMSQSSSPKAGDDWNCDDVPRSPSPLFPTDRYAPEKRESKTNDSFIARHYFGENDHSSNRDSTGSRLSMPTREERDTLDSVLSRRITRNDSDSSHQQVLTAKQGTSQHSIDSHRSALSAVKEGDWSSLMGIIHECPEVIMMRCDSNLISGLHGCRGGSLLHVLLLQRPVVMKMNEHDKSYNPKVELISAVPEAIIHTIISRDKTVLSVADQDGRLPLHTAVLATSHASSAKKRYMDEKLPYAVPHINEEQYVVQHGHLIRTIITGFEEATSVPDRKGCLPIHYALAQPRDKNPLAGENISEKSLAAVAIWTVKLLLKTNPSSVAHQNYHGQQPIHVVCSRGESANLWNLRSVLTCHKARRISPCGCDKNGDSPLHLAIKSRVSHHAVECLIKSDPSLKLTQLLVNRDAQNNLPLHTAMLLSDPIPSTEVMLAIMDAAPFSLTVPDSSGRLPILRAIERGFPSIVIRRLLEADMPIELGNQDSSAPSSSSDRRKVGSRVHSFSWWHVAVGGGNKYLQMIHEFLSTSATQPQILELLNHVGPDGASSVREAVSDESMDMFSSLLWCLDRYQLVINSADSCRRKSTKEYIVFHAWDYGPHCSAGRKRREWSESYLSGTLSGWTPCPVQVDNAEKNEGEDDSGVEVFLTEQPREKRKVILHFYDHEEAFLAEIKVRKLHNLSPLYTESIYNTHYNIDCREMSLGGHSPSHCIAYEVPDHTLARVFQLTSSGSRSPKWIRKCRIVLKQIATALSHLHDQGLVHGDVDPNNIAKYGNSWKMTKIGTVTPAGLPMRGVLRPCVPPESISGTPGLSSQGSRGGISSSVSVISSTSVSISASRVTFAEEDLLLDDMSCDPSVAGSRGMKGYKLKRSSSKGSIDSSKWDGQSEKDSVLLGDDVMLRFAPESCSASPSWDVWSFGLVMVQLLVGRTTILPNFEKATDAHMRNLSTYSKSNLKKIYQQVQAIGGREAADLVGRVLRPNPDRRPTMQRVLQHSYFDEKSQLKSMRSSRTKDSPQTGVSSEG